MQLVDLSTLHHGDVIAVVMAPTDEGTYEVIQGIFSSFRFSDDDNHTYITMNNTIRDVRSVVSGDTIEHDTDSVMEVVIFEEEADTTKYYLIEPQGWRA